MKIRAACSLIYLRNIGLLTTCNGKHFLTNIFHLPFSKKLLIGFKYFILDFQYNMADANINVDGYIDFKDVSLQEAMYADKQRPKIVQVIDYRSFDLCLLLDQYGIQKKEIVKRKSNIHNMDLISNQCVYNTNEFIDFLDGEITEEKLRKIYPLNEDLKYAIFFLNNPNIRIVLREFKAAKSDYISLIAFLNGDYKKRELEINNICREEIELIYELNVSFGSFGLVIFKSGFLDNYMIGMSGFWTFIETDKELRPKFKQLELENIVKRNRKSDFTSKKINDDDLQPFVDLLNIPGNVDKGDFQKLCDYFGVKNKINEATIQILNDNEIRIILKSLAKSENINTLLRVIFMDFSDKNLYKLFENQKLYDLIERLKIIFAQDLTLKTTVMNLFCSYYKIDNNKKMKIFNNLDNLLNIKFLKDVLALYNGDIGYFRFCCLHPKLAVVLI